jgi:GNAT superfamily N-acetyltransferase
MIRPAVAADIESLIQLIHDLAEYERSPGSVEIEAEHLHEALFSPSPTVFAHVAEADGRIEGMAIWFLTFSTWTGRNGIHLEDLYVRPEARSRGIGRALLTELAIIALRSGYARLEWSVLDWNEPAIFFYETLGATIMHEWKLVRVTGEALEKMAKLK